MSSHGCFYQKFVTCNDLHAFDAYVQLRGGLRADFQNRREIIPATRCTHRYKSLSLASFSLYKQRFPNASVVVAPKVAASSLPRGKMKMMRWLT